MTLFGRELKAGLVVYLRDLEVWGRPMPYAEVSNCDLVDCSLPGSSIPGILQARIPEWVAMPSCRVSSPPRNRT